jgi:hypothetical protein
MFRTLFHTLQIDQPSGLAPVPQTTLPPFIQQPQVSQQIPQQVSQQIPPQVLQQPLAQQPQQPNGIAPPDPIQAEIRAQEQKQWLFDLENARQKHQFKDDKASPLFYQRVDHAVCPTEFRMKGTMQQALEVAPPLPTYEVKPDALFQFVTSPPLSFHDPNAISQVLREPTQGVAFQNKAIPRIQEARNVESYPFCSDLADTLTAPFDRACLQQLFRAMGGESRGTAYPQDANLHLYHSMGTLGAVKQYLGHLRAQTNSTDYSIQREAMMQFLGVTPEQLIRRAPYHQGVEVFWFVTAPGSPHRILGFLQRMIQPDIVHYYESSSPLINGMLQLTDIRLKGVLTCHVNARDGVWIAVNQPTHIDHDIFHQDPLSEGRKGHDGLAVKMDGSPTPVVLQVKDAAPRVTRIYSSGLSMITSDVLYADKPIPAAAYSLTCEPRAPFLTYEVGPTSHLFEELRNPGIFEQFQEIIQLEYHLHSVEREQVPGKKAFVRMNSAHSMIGLPNLAYQSWKTMTVAIRLRTMPIRDTLFHFMMGRGSYAVIIQKDGSLSIEHNLGGGPILTVPTRLSLSINRWYLCSIEHNAYTFELRCDPIGDSLPAVSTPVVAVSSQTGIPLYSPNAIWQTEPCHIMVGTTTKRGLQGWNSLYATSSFFYDLAWIHFFDRVLTKEDRTREYKANWIYTAYPDVSGAYNT